MYFIRNFTEEPVNGMMNQVVHHLPSSIRTKFGRSRSLKDSRIAWIGCSPRSGSTLLTRILNSHSKIASPCELAIPKYFPKGDVKEEIVWNKYKQICGYYQAELERSKIDPRYLMRQVLFKEGKETLVLKDPRQSLFLEAIAQDFPQSKFIHLVRDVRSVAMSQMFKDRPADGFKRWYDYNYAVSELLAQQTLKQTFLIRYEDIVEKPKQTIAQLVNFLGYEFEPSMLDYGQFDHADDKMRLWDGTTPSKSPLHLALKTQTISKKVAVYSTNFSQSVLDLYARSSQIQTLNQRFGY